jgi:mono/diheme cytochrome c family protein
MLQMRPSLTLIGAALCSMLLLAACGGQPASNQAAQTPEPTVTPFPTFNFQVPTALPQFATAAATARSSAESTAGVQAVSLDPEAVERGKARYEALGCAACHGANGEGTDEGGPLAGTTLTEGEFITVLRTGGGLGSFHLFAANRLSDSGGHNIYQYVLSLSETE